MRAKNKITKLNYEEVVVGSCLNSLLFAFCNNLPVVFSEINRPFKFDYLERKTDLSKLKIPQQQRTIKAINSSFVVGTPKEILWERLLFLLSMNSMVPLSNLSTSIRNFENTISCFNEYSKIANIEYDKCYYFGDANSSGFVKNKVLDSEKYLCYDWVAFNRGGKHEFDYIKTESQFVSEVWFYSSDRIHGKTKIKDACIVSVLDKKQLENFNYSETMARFKLVHEMELLGIKGRFNGYSKNGKPKYYKFRTSSISRQKNKRRNAYESKSENIEIPETNQKFLLQNLQESCVAHDRFLKWL